MPYITVKGQRMFYLDEGTGFSVLFGHSYLWDSSMWEPQIKELSASYRCIVPDLWGHGRSDPPPQSPYSIEALAEDAWELAQALKLERFAVVGLSVGGMWAVHLALAHPEAVAALVLMDTYVGPEPKESAARYFQMIGMVEKLGRIPPQMLDALLPLFFSPATLQRSPKFVEEFRSQLTSIPPERIPGILALGKGIFSRNSVLERLGEIKAPTLIIVGKDDRSRPPHEAQKMAELIPGARLEIIPDAGHISNLEKPEEVTALLKAFLSEALGNG